MGNRTFSLPIALVDQLAASRRWHIAVETGTYDGDGAAILAERFDNVWTLEALPSRAAEAAARMRRDGLSNVHVLVGSSEIVLIELLATLDQPAVFWLDAHWFPKLAVSAAPQCSVLAEIQCIAQWKHAASSCVLIDDISLFRNLPALPGYRGHEWPSEAELRHTVQANLPYHAANLWDDVLVVSPAR